MTRSDVSTDPDIALARHAGRQAGAFHRTAALRLGFTPRMIELRRSGGGWIQVTRDVFLLAGFPNTWEQRCWVATLLHPAAALSHQTSAHRLGLDGFRPGRVHITVPPTAPHRWPIVTVHRSRHTQFRPVGHVRTTTFAQTMIQLAEHQPETAIRSALRSGIERRPARAEALRKRLGELRHRRLPGFGRLIGQLDEIDAEPPTTSELEAQLFELLASVPGIPPIARQVAMPWSPSRPAVVDGFVAPWRLIVEGDGRRWHTRVADFERDRWRDNEAAIHGLHVMRFTWRRLQDDPDGVIDQVARFGRRALAAAA